MTSVTTLSCFLLITEFPDKDTSFFLQCNQDIINVSNFWTKLTVTNKFSYGMFSDISISWKRYFCFCCYLNLWENNQVFLEKLNVQHSLSSQLLLIFSVKKIFIYLFICIDTYTKIKLPHEKISLPFHFAEKFWRILSIAF